LKKKEKKDKEKKNTEKNYKNAQGNTIEIKEKNKEKRIK